MSSREEYISKRLMELSFIAETRELAGIEKEEERKLLEELKSYRATE